MKEIQFLQQNSNRWKELEEKLNSGQQHDPNILSELYIQLTDDLSYSHTYFPKSTTTEYLNELASRVHRIIYKNKREKKTRLYTFWVKEYPLIIFQNQRYILYSFLIFGISILIGIFSSAYDDHFARLILGDPYVNMTLHNIEKGDPLAIYKEMNQMDMFLGISLNNLYVAFLAFVMGVVFSFGTGVILFRNGVMLGVFHYFFYKHGLFYESIRTIWIHGTLEVFAIIVSGAAGLIVGNSIIFPKTYTRIKSFQRAVKTGLKMVFGLIPVFITAAFFEGFVTRYTNMPDILGLMIILLSLLFITWYFFYYPYILTKKQPHGIQRTY